MRGNKINCDDGNSKIICQLFNKYDEHGENYVRVNYVVSKLMKVNRMDIIMDVPCFFVNGTTENGYGEFSGTRFVYQGETLYDEIIKWYKQYNRNKKIESLGF